MSLLELNFSGAEGVISSVLGCYWLSPCQTAADIWSGEGEENFYLSPIRVKEEVQAGAYLGFRDF